MGDLMAVLPFINNMVRMSLKGSDLLKVLEWSVYDYNPNEHKGKFLQFSGKQQVYTLRTTNYSFLTVHPLNGYVKCA
jgi:2',3'-cyclic-nucleotide 2'-phosphodiesterase (5'-nucleotidase family)